MKNETLEQRLREKLPAPAPRPGFETRIQAMAREPSLRKKSGLLRLLALPALALIVAALILLPRDEPAPQAVVEVPDTPPAPVVRLEEPVSREYQGLKNDAQWTLSLFRNTLPSIPLAPPK